MFKFSPGFLIVVSFFFFIFVGGLLLTLPICSSQGVSTNFLDSLFTANAAGCVTSLNVFDVGTYYSFIGLIVILIMIQIGGLGYMAFSTFLMLIFRRKMFISEKILVEETLHIHSAKDIFSVLRKICVIVFSVEAIGALLLFIAWLPGMGAKKALWYAVFHSVSAFCNAGFSLFPGFTSLMPYATDPLVNLTITILIIIGGIGFIPISEIVQKKRFSLQTKTVLITTLILLLTATAIFFCLERTNPLTMGGMSVPQQVLSSWFLAVTSRTAGFHTVNTASLFSPTLLFVMLLMFIGASPGGTGGGIKTTTFSLFLATMWATLQSWRDTVLFRRKIPFDVVRRAFTIISLSVVMIGVAVLALSYFEKEATLLALFFEVVSAFASVGLSTGLTPTLSAAGRLILILVMFIGRVGPLTLLLALTLKQRETKVEYPKEGIAIG